MNALETVKFAGWMLIGALAYVSTITIGAFAAAASGPLTAFSDNALYIVAGGFGIAAACAFFAPPGLALLRTRF